MSITGRPQATIMSNPRADRVKDVAKLAGRSVRLKRRQFLAEGPQAVREALSAHRANIDSGGDGIVAEVFATDACLDRLPELADLADGVPLRLATDAVLAAMADTVNPQGIVAVCHYLDRPLNEVLQAKPLLLAIMVRVQDPGNAGTILRAADSAGADAVILTSSSVDIYNPKAVRSTAGSLFHLPVVTGHDFDELAAALRAAGLTMLAADGYGTIDLDDLQDRSALRRLGSGSASDDGGGLPDLAAPTAWLFGNEAQGLSSEELASAAHRVAVPVYGQAESLNVGTAATVCLYASARSQRRGGQPV
ncbi:RNA methyltransferase [Arthrobacter sp. CAU 1506]|uniref:TrmH family RNA methyltransferase n=1 Tax=Arthrobacter sp. CAU 1506 TaxID=2560052 RepID=UPI0010AD30DF|nr:RNA methyltransferase [Arthrobacter sp. CAU 1506]TJY72156.1 RNA methyltransferase [Arthrobacter sp. CAU 1506]